MAADNEREVLVPELGESVVEATVGRWLKAEGEYVRVGDVLVELETDKVNLEVGADAAGRLARRVAPEGKDVAIGDVLAVIDTTAAKDEAGDSEGGEGDRDESGDRVKDEAAGGERGERDGVAASSGDREVGEASGGDRDERDERDEHAAAPDRAATPVARRMAAKHDLDIATLDGSGQRGRVTRSDVEQAIDSERSDRGGAIGASAAPSGDDGVETAARGEVTAGATERGERRERLSRRRRTIASRLVEAQHTAAMLTTFNDADMSAVIAMRLTRGDGFRERHGVKLGFMSFFVKASVAALRDFPALNAELDGDEIVFKDYYDIGMAIGDAEGLVVPVIRDADRLGFAEIEQAIRDYAAQVEDGTLSVSDLRGGTFTITNGGVFGSLMSTPILNPPQVGILGLHRIEERPVAIDGEVVVRPMMYLALTYDHRIVDGREAVQFLGRIKDLVEDPAAMLLA